METAKPSHAILGSVSMGRHWRMQAGEFHLIHILCKTPAGQRFAPKWKGKHYWTCNSQDCKFKLHGLQLLCFPDLRWEGSLGVNSSSHFISYLRTVKLRETACLRSPLSLAPVWTLNPKCAEKAILRCKLIDNLERNGALGIVSWQAVQPTPLARDISQGLFSISGGQVIIHAY